MRINKIGSDAEINARVRELFQTVGLDPRRWRLSARFSGGHARHRIARSLSLIVARRRRRAGLGPGRLGTAQVLNLMTASRTNSTHVSLIAHD